MNTAGKTHAEAKVTRTAFVVVGMHRSGTSAMARTLSLLGAALPRQLMLAHEDNPTGFWEPQSVADLNDEILQALDSEWDDVFAFRPKQYLSNFDQFYVGRAVELLEQEFNGSEVIVLKDPRISVLTAFWDRALKESGYSTHYIVMVRNPLEVAESLRTRDSFPREKSLLLWSSYMLAVDRDTRQQSRTFVSYEQLMSEWRQVRDRIQIDVGVPFPRDTAAAALEIDRFLDRRLRHHQSASEDLLSRADVPEEVKALFKIFSAACEGAEIDLDCVQAIRAELEKIDTIIGPLVADLRSRTRSLGKEVAELYKDRAAEVERANSLQEERDRLAAELEAKRAAANELSAQIVALEEQRDGLTKLAESKSAEAIELGSRIALLEEERDGISAIAERRRVEAAEVGSRLEAAESYSAQLRDLHESEKARAERISEELDELARKQQNLSFERTKLERKLADAEEKAKRSEQRFRGEQRKAEAEIRSACAAVADGEQKLAERFRELATLTSLLRDQEHRLQEEGQRIDAARERLRWFAAVDEQVRNQPRWWSLMPEGWRRMREQERLRIAGLFDREAYLAANPDVAAEGIDPLKHYVRHGIHEDRRRSK